MSEEQPKLGLRERKKLRTRALIQQHALRLFREKGYYETTIEQIAEAAEISPSTLFRYFPTKESLVLEDDYDPHLIEEFRKQPSELSPLKALRNAMRIGLVDIPQEEREVLQQRMELMQAVPELRAASLNAIRETVRMIAEIVSERAGKSVDIKAIVFAGAVVGAINAVVNTHDAVSSGNDFFARIDEALSLLEDGLPL